jgi:hypothetical protein
MKSVDFNFAEWLTQVVPEIYPNYWMNDEINRYNMWEFLIWFANELDIKLD